MKIRNSLYASAFAATLFAISGCNSEPVKANVCNPPEGHDLNQAMQQAKQDLSDICGYRFNAYFSQLMKIAEGDPQPANKEKFSDFMMWAHRTSLLSKRQARELYNRYFNVKYVSLMGDYNNCSTSCTRQQQLISEMQQELLDKEQGLLKISRDNSGYQRADRLLQETELVLEATCTACRSN